MFDFRFFFFNSTHNCPKFLLSDGPHTGSWRVKKELQEPRSTRGKEATVNAGNTDWERRGGQAGKGGSPYSTAKWFSYTCIYTHPSLYSFALQFITGY